MEFENAIRVRTLKVISQILYIGIKKLFDAQIRLEIQF